MGVWVHDLILNLAKSGDTDGAMWIFNKLPEESPRGLFLMLIASAQTERGDFAGAEQTLEKLEGNKYWRDVALVKVAHIRKVKGDADGAQRLASKIYDLSLRDVVFGDKSSSSTQSDA